MELKNLSIVFFSLMSTTSIRVTGKILINSHGSPLLTDVAVEIIETCYADGKQDIVLFGNFGNFDSRLFLHGRPVITINNSTKKCSKGSNKREKMSIFIISIKTNIESNLQALRESLWWKSDGLFIILNESHHMSKNCENAWKILSTAWKMDILNALFLCETAQSIFLYTFNPFTQRAPHPWKMVENSSRQLEKKWTLYRRKYTADPVNCINLIYDKTIHLDNYAGIKALAQTNHFNRTNGKIDSYDNDVVQILYKALNAKFVYDGVKRAGFFNSFGDPVGYMESLANGEHDILLERRPLGYAKFTVPSSIHSTTEVYILSQSKGFISSIQEIYDMFGIHMIVLVIFLSAVIIFIFMISLKGDIIKSILETIRYWLGYAFHNLPTDTFSQLSLYNIILSGFLIQTYFQGSLLSFLASPRAIQNIDDYDQLMELSVDYKIYHHDIVTPYIGEELRRRTNIENEFRACYQNASINHRYICIADKLYAIYPSVKKPFLHMSKKYISSKYMVYRMRDDWPLTKRVNDITTGMFESGLLNLLTKKDENRKSRGAPRENSKRVEFPEQWHVMSKDDFKYAFKTWTYGLGIASVFFLFEFLCNYLWKT